MITIIEGADGVGKSSQATYLNSRIPGVILHFERPRKEWIDEYVVSVGRWVGDEHVILDRSFIGSRVWSSLGYHPPTLTDAQWISLCRWYAMNGARLQVVVRAPADINAELYERGDTHEYIAEVLWAQRKFLALVMAHSVPYIPTTIVTSDMLHHIRTT